MTGEGCLPAVLELADCTGDGVHDVAAAQGSHEPAFPVYDRHLLDALFGERVDCLVERRVLVHGDDAFRRDVHDVEVEQVDQARGERGVILETVDVERRIEQRDVVTAKVEATSPSEMKPTSLPFSSMTPFFFSSAPMSIIANSVS